MSHVSFTNSNAWTQLNGAMTTLYMRSLSSGGLSSLQATTASTAANIIASGALGRLVFRERLSLGWLVGAACLVSGASLITAAGLRGVRSEGPRRSHQSRKED